MHSDVLMLARQVEAKDRAVIATDSSGHVIYWGPGAESLYGWTEQEALGRHIVEITPGEMSRDDAEDILRSLMNGDPWSGNFPVRRKDGSRFVAHVTDVPVHDNGGALIGIVGISRRVSPSAPELY